MTARPNDGESVADLTSVVDRIGAAGPHRPAAPIARQPNILFNSTPEYPCPSSVKVPFSAISRAARMKPLHAVRASEPPTLMRRTPSAAAYVTERPEAPIGRLTGLGCTAFTIAEISSLVLTPGA
jgi:hypothetical protein